jgi:hypothetical protein
MRLIKSLLLVVAALVLLGAALGLFGVYDVAADTPHWRPVYALLEWARDRSIAARADDIEAPPLDDPELLAAGAEHYAAMCTGCHLAPDARADTELRAGLYPQPPKLIERNAERSPAETFWIIKHGIKSTGMPAWGKTHDDRAIWGLVALVERLPRLSAEDYAALVRGGGGHAHGHGAAAHGHEHGEAAPASDEEAHAHDNGTEGDEAHDHAPAASGAADRDAHHDHAGGATPTPASPAHEHEGEPHGHGEAAAMPEHGDHEAEAATADQRPASAHAHGESSADHEHADHAHDAAAAPVAAPAARGAGHAMPKAGPEPSAEPVAVVERFLQRLAGGDTEGAWSLLDPSVLIYESGGVERSRDDYAAHHLPRDAEFLKSARHHLLSRGGDSSGALAYVASEARLSAGGEAKPAELITTETMVLRRTDDQWRIVHIHWSSRPAPAAAGAAATAHDRPLATGELAPALRAALARGDGVGLAKPAEVNGFPGPRHVLDLADALELDAAQRTASAAIYQRMHERARGLGAEYIAAWDALNELWRGVRVDAAELRRRTTELGRLEGELRAVHLDAHREQAALLSTEQRRRYATLRQGHARPAGA